VIVCLYNKGIGTLFGLLMKLYHVTYEYFYQNCCMKLESVLGSLLLYLCLLVTSLQIYFSITSNAAVFGPVYFQKGYQFLRYI
jgi:hypothetical protein